MTLCSKSAEEHDQHLLGLSTVLRTHRLHAKRSTCSFNSDELHFLGYIVNQHGITADPASTAAVAVWPQPTDVKQLHSFLGLANHYRKFVSSFSHAARCSDQGTH